jgi:hypothetical protein
MVASFPTCLSATSPLFLSSRSSSPAASTTKQIYHFQALLKFTRLKKGAADSEYAPEMSSSTATHKEQDAVRLEALTKVFSIPVDPSASLPSSFHM